MAQHSGIKTNPQLSQQRLNIVQLKVPMQTQHICKLLYINQLSTFQQYMNCTVPWQRVLVHLQASWGQTARWTAASSGR